MKEVYIKADNLNKWVSKHFKNQDIIPISDLLSVIEDLTFEIDELKGKIKELEEPKEQWRGKEYGE